MKVDGLEGALVSHAPRKITSLTADADRSCILKVAGPAALLVSKVHKVGERLEPPRPLGEIESDLQALEKEITDLLSEVVRS